MSSQKFSTQTIKQKLEQHFKQPQNANNMLFQIINSNQVHITFNRPKLLNAFSLDMYFSFCQYIEKANEMQQIKYIVLKGAGGNFTSGNDLTNFMNPLVNQFDKILVANAMADVLSQLTFTIVKSKKPIFAVVEGKTIGFGFTQLALYDRVFAVQNSYFMAPLVRTAQGPEMASSYLFPKIFGYALAQQIIVLSKEMKAKELQKYNFLTCYKNIGEANKALQAYLHELDQLEWLSYLETRRLMRLPDKQNILIANSLQSENLIQRWKNPQLLPFMMKYLSTIKAKPKL